MALTDATARAAKPRSKPYKMTDEKGLFLLVQPTGGKLWRYNYAMGGKRKTLSIGQYPNVSLAAAREGREDARRLISKGIDPSQHKQQAKKAEKVAVTTFRDVAKKVLADARKKKLAAVTINKKEWLLRPPGSPAPTITPSRRRSARSPSSAARTPSRSPHGCPERA
jgi:hypothetical protein